MSPSIRDPRVRRQRGQASVEWLAVVMLVGTLLGLGAGLAQAGYVGRRVTREMARAICLVAEGDCRRDQEPCVVGAQAARQGLTVQLLFVRLGEDKLGVIEERSDGTFAVTLEDGIKGGLAATDGLGAGVRVGKLGATVGGEVTASLLARLGHGRTWIVGSRAEALALLEHDGDGRPPDALSGSGTWTSSVGVDAGAGVAGQTFDVARAGIAFDRQVGWRVDRQTGHRTAYVQASATLSAAAGGGVLGLSSGGGEERYAVEHDASGRPLDLRVIATGPLGGSRDLPAVVQPVAGLLAAGAATSGRGYEVTGHLDLTDAANIEAARAFLHAIADRRATAEPARALRRRLDERGTVQARVLATSTDTTGASADVTAGLARLSVDAEIERSSQQLLAATSRGLDGQWVTRTDCVA
jgi:hypothetical protein